MGKLGFEGLLGPKNAQKLANFRVLGLIFPQEHSEMVKFWVLGPIFPQTTQKWANWASGPLFPPKSLRNGPFWGFAPIFPPNLSGMGKVWVVRLGFFSPQDLRNGQIVVLGPGFPQEPSGMGEFGFQGLCFPRALSNGLHSGLRASSFFLQKQQEWVKSDFWASSSPRTQKLNPFGLQGLFVFCTATLRNG